MNTLPALYPGAAAWVAGVVLAAASVYDLRERRIPNRLTGAATVVVLGLWLAGGMPGGLWHVASAALAPLLLLTLRALGMAWRGRPGIGLGDVKLALVLGLGLGLGAVVVVWLGLTLAGVWAVGGLLLGRLSRSDTLPLAPFLAAAYALRLGFPQLLS